jgi:hypothetical protein
VDANSTSGIAQDANARAFAIVSRLVRTHAPDAYALMELLAGISHTLDPVRTAMNSGRDAAGELVR